jgi:hypothetical protein
MAFQFILRHFFCRAACLTNALAAVICCSLIAMAADSNDSDKQPADNLKSDQAAQPSNQNEASRTQPVTIPLKSIWGGRLQGTRMFGQFDLDMPAGLAPTPLGVDIDKALSTAPAAVAKPGFVVLGKSGEALLGAHAVLAENKKPLEPIPADSEVSLVFFAYGSDFSAHLHDVEVDGHNITMRYQFVPESIKEMKPTYALISLGKLSAGDYHVAMTQLPMDQKYIQRGITPTSDADVHRLVCQSFDFTVKPSEITFKEVGQLDGIDGAELRLGARDRMIFVDDVWELDRCARLIPDLPWADLRKESLVVLMNWTTRTRCIDYVRPEGATLVIGIKEQIVRAEPMASQPSFKFWVARLPTWFGPVRFELNGKRQFTIVRGVSLNQQADRIWEEILQIHSGARLSRPEFVKYLLSQSPRMSDQEATDAAFDKEKVFRTPATVMYPILFEELINIRARPVIPRIFELLKATGKFDPILEHVRNALVGIGGPELVVNAKEALNSWNPRCRETAMGALAAIGDQETRPLAYRLMDSDDLGSIRGGLSILNGIGPRKSDVEQIVYNMQRLESTLFDPPNGKRGPNYDMSSSGDIDAFIFTLAGMGAQAKDAMPVLEQMATKPKYPLSTTLQESAQNAVDKIKQNPPSDLPSK